MNTTNHHRRAFLGTLATGAAAGLTFASNQLEAGIGHLDPEKIKANAAHGAAAVETMLNEVGSMQHPVAYDVSQANQWGFVWSNVYYLTNEGTGTASNELGVLNVLRHHGFMFALNDEVINEYKVGEFMGYEDPVTKKFAVRNPYVDVQDGTFPVPGLDGLPGLQAKGARFCVCDMAMQVYAGFIGDKHGVSSEQVYNDFVANMLPGIESAPSGVWVLGRLSEHNIAYIDSSVG